MLFRYYNGHFRHLCVDLELYSNNAIECANWPKLLRFITATQRGKRRDFPESFWFVLGNIFNCLK